MKRANHRPQRATQPIAPPPEVVDPVWILKAVGALLALGLLCSYVTICLYFYLGQWQLVLHPAHGLSTTPAARHLVFDPVRFADDLGGQPELSGWWVPAQPVTDRVALLAHGGTGTMSDALPTVEALHDAGLNVFVFDYRGYGQSQGAHPTQAGMQHDLARAYEYLTRAKHIPVQRILLCGEELGASLATQFAAAHPEVPAMILFRANGDTLTRVEAEQRSHIVPVPLFFHERFPLADTLAVLHTPKLLISFDRGPAPVFAQRAAMPKVTVELDPTAQTPQVASVIRSFIDGYLRPSASPSSAGS